MQNLPTLSVCAAIIALAGCGGSQGPMPSGLSTQTRGRESGKSWMLPEAKRTKELLYISDQATDHVYVYDYKTRRLLGRLNGFYKPAGQCVDANGDVWITDSTAEAVVRYAHGALRRSKRIRTIGLPNSCSIDPTHGNLAVSDSSTPRNKGSKIEVFDATGKRKVYSSKSCQRIVQVGYDNTGNLYVSGSPSDYSSHVCELPYGGAALEQISIDKTIVVPAGVMWDGKYITFTDRLYAFNYTAIYQAEPNGSGGLHVVGQTDFQGGKNSCKFTNLIQPFIVGSQNTPSNNQQGNAVVAGNNECFYGSGDAFQYWSYPGGGTPTHTVFDGPTDPSGQSVSIATSGQRRSSLKR